jgi:hypothetical protein
MAGVSFELADARHDAALRRVLAENPMDGEISLAFEREPSYFHASAVQAPFHQVVAGRDRRTGEIVGMGTRAVRPGFINGEPADVGYLADLRLDPRYRGGTVIARAYRHLAELHADARVRLYFTVIAEGNARALLTIASGRAGLPPYRDLGRLLSPALNLRRRRPPVDAGVEIARGTPARLAEIVDCLNRNNRRRQFAPRYRVTDIGSAWLRGLQVEDFYLALRGGRIVGTLVRWDQSAFKQTVVKRYGPRLAALRRLYNLAAALTNWPRYPPPGRALRSFYASLLAVDGDDVDVARALLTALYNDHTDSGYHYFVVGLHEHDPLLPCLAGFPQTPFAGRIFAVHFDDGEAAFRRLDGRPPYVEIAML